MIQPADYDEPPAYKPRVKLPQPLIESVGLIAWSEAVQMYNNPYAFYPEPPPPDMKGERLQFSITTGLNAYDALYTLRMIGASEAGYQLTADGRYYVRESMLKITRDEAKLKRQFEREEREYYAHSHMDVW